MYKTTITLSFLGLASFAIAQPTTERIAKLETEQSSLSSEKIVLLEKLEKLKLKKIREDLKEVIGLPVSSEKGELLEHSGMILKYNEAHKQASWATHIVLPIEIEGILERNADFKADDKLTGGIANNEIYKKNGFDLGHLVPPADFRWSATARAETYLYSNMSPQRPELNRERWAELEAWVRRHSLTAKKSLVVVTGGLLDTQLPSIGENEKISVPKLFWKVVLDSEGEQQKAIGFVMPNKECPYPVISYAVSVDSVERLTGMDFFSKLDDATENKLESSFETDLWDSPTIGDLPDQPPMRVEDRPKNTINSHDTEQFIGQKVTVCGVVVSTKKTKSGTVFINLDTKFPNHVFSASVWRTDMQNFSYKPEEELLGKKVCLTGKITDYKGKPTMNLPNEKKIKFLED